MIYWVIGIAVYLLIVWISLGVFRSTKVKKNKTEGNCYRIDYSTPHGKYFFITRAKDLTEAREIASQTPISEWIKI